MFGFRELRAWRMESLELEERRVWKHEFKGKHPIFFFLFLFYFGFGFGGRHCQFWKRPAPFFFFFFCCLWEQVGAITKFWQNVKLLFFPPPCFVACGCMWAPSSTLSRKGAQAPICFSFCSFCFVAFGCKWAPLATFNKKGAQAPFFSSFFVSYGCRWVPLPSSNKGGTCSPFFSSFLLVLGCHH